MDTFEIADTTAIDDFDLCLRFVFPLEILFGGDTITVTDEDGLLDFVEERDSLNQLFDFVYPLNLIYQGIDTSVHSIIELIGVVETCAEVIGDLLTRNSTRLLSTKPIWTEKFKIVDNSEILIYPNPVSHELIISLPLSTNNESYSIDIFDNVGKNTIHIDNAYLIERIKTTGLASGIYILLVQNKMGAYSSAIMIEN